MIGAFIKQKNTIITGIVTGLGAIKAGKTTIPAVKAVTCHGCECVIPVDEVEVVSPPEPKPIEGDFSSVLQHWGVDTPERLNKALGLFDGVWDEYDRLSQEERNRLPMWLGKALAEMVRGW